MEMHKDIPIYLFQKVHDWEEWLFHNDNDISAVWLKFAKKNSGAVSITYAEALEVALCYGWIDGIINSFDEKYYLTRFTPRKAKSVWSKRNVELVEKLIREGKMKASGLAVIEAAKIHGNWYNVYDGSNEMRIPDDLLQQLSKNKKAEDFFNSLNRANKYAIVWRLQTASRPEIRVKRMETILTKLKKGETYH